MRNKYFYRSHIPEKQFRSIIRCFSKDLMAVETSEKTGISRKTANHIFFKIRQRIYENNKENAHSRFIELGINTEWFYTDKTLSKINNRESGMLVTLVIVQLNRKVLSEFVYLPSVSFKTA
ncbi:MAG: hypothetical protein ACR2N3_05065 [Pyrinomonadaceae bacterium]